MKVMVSVRFDSRLIPPPQAQPPKRWRALSALSADPINISRRWAQQAGRSFPVQLGSVKTLVSFEPELWSIAHEHTGARTLAPRLSSELSPLRGPEISEALTHTTLTDVIQALTRCTAVHAAEHLEGLSVTGPLHDRWRELCVWTSHVALLQIDLKRSSTVHSAHRQHLNRLEERWSIFHPESISAPLSPRAARATLSNLEHLPHLGTLGSALGAKVALTAQLFFSLNALGQWFWIWINQSPQLLNDLQTELSVTLRDIPYLPQLWRSLPTLSSTVLELFRLYPPQWCLSAPIVEGPLLQHLRATPALSSLFDGRRPPTHLLLPTYWRHRDERLWTSPERFDPSRFLPYIRDELSDATGSDERAITRSTMLTSSQAQLTFHALMSLLTSFLRRGMYRIDEATARDIAQRPPALQGGALSPSGEAMCRFETSDHVAYIRSTRV